MSSRRNLERWIRDWVLWFGGSWKQNALAERIKTTIGGFGVVKPNAWDFNAGRRGWWVWKISRGLTRHLKRCELNKKRKFRFCLKFGSLRRGGVNSTVTARKESRLKRGKIVNLSACVDEITLRCELNSS